MKKMCEPDTNFQDSFGIKLSISYLCDIIRKNATLEEFKIAVENVEDIHYNNDCILVFVIIRHRYDLLKYLLQNHLEIHASNGFHWAMKIGNKKILKICFKNGAKISEADLAYTAEFNNKDAIKFFLHKKCVTQGNAGRWAIEWATIHNDVKTVKLLMRNGCTFYGGQVFKVEKRKIKKFHKRKTRMQKKKHSWEFLQ